MSKPENFGVIVFLGFLVMCLCTVIFWGMLKFAIQEGEGKRQRNENQKAALLLREERKRLEEVLEKLMKEKTDE